jgi:uncharacterized protein (TIGR04222 family)
MDWWLSNPLAEMRGPEFLMFYGVFAALVVISAYFFIDMQDMTGSLAPPPTPADIDAYELAYLRGGINEVIRTAIYALRQQRLIEIIEKGRIRTTGERAGARAIADIEDRVLAAIRPAPTIAALFKDRNLRANIESACERYRRRLSAQQLLAPPEKRRAGHYALAIGLGLLVALAAYKLGLAIQNHRSNVGLLCVEGAGACMILLVLFNKTTAATASKRGKAFLAQTQLAFAPAASSAFNTRAGNASAGTGSALFMVGLFGFSILSGTPDAALAQQFSRATQSGGDGGGCGSGGGDGGGGGGCGGCGGGD